MASLSTFHLQLVVFGGDLTKSVYVCNCMHVIVCIHINTLHKEPCLPGVSGLCCPAGLDPECHAEGEHYVWQATEGQLQIP